MTAGSNKLRCKLFFGFSQSFHRDSGINSHHIANPPYHFTLKVKLGVLRVDSIQHHQCECEGDVRVY